MTREEIEREPWLGDQRAKVLALLERAEKAEAFKRYVHGRLDEAGVPADPEPEETMRHGCRIEGRLNYLVRNLDQSLANALVDRRDARRRFDWAYALLGTIEQEARQRCSERLRGWERWQKVLDWAKAARGGP